MIIDKYASLVTTAAQHFLGSIGGFKSAPNPKDFQKGDEPARWAPGYPMYWGSEEIKIAYAGDEINAARVSPDEKFVAVSVERDDKIYILDTDSFQEVGSLESEIEHVTGLFWRDIEDSKGYELIVHGVKLEHWEDLFQRYILDKNGKTALSAVRSTTTKGKISGFDPTPLSHDQRKLAYFYEERSGPDRNISLMTLDLVTGETVAMSDYTDSIMSVSWSPDNGRVITASWDGYLRMWEVEKGELLDSFGPFSAQCWQARFSPDGKQVLISCSGGSDSQIYILERKGKGEWSGESLGGFQGMGARTVSWNPDGKSIAGGSFNLLQVYEAEGGARLQIWSPDDYNEEVADAIWLQDGKKLAFNPLNGGFEMYDFEKNLKYRWTAGAKDKVAMGYWENRIFELKGKGLIGNLCQDGVVRFWRMPE